jgi:hypothetical protein
MMELGEGLCKLRKLRLDKDDGEPFIVFRDEVAAVLHFLYCTQKELAACKLYSLANSVPQHAVGRIKLIDDHPIDL